jgi:hypothetical protein
MMAILIIVTANTLQLFLTSSDQETNSWAAGLNLPFPLALRLKPFRVINAELLSLLTSSRGRRSLRNIYEAHKQDDVTETPKVRNQELNPV